MTLDDSPPLSVLVVDGDADTARSTADLLALWGHAARVARRGADALASPPADVVLLDLRLPDADGCGLARRLRDRAAGGLAPFLVAVTGCGCDAERRRFLAAGGDALLVKPADPAALGALLGRVRAFLGPAAAGVPS